MRVALYARVSTTDQHPENFAEFFWKQSMIEGKGPVPPGTPAFEFDLARERPPFN